MKKLEEAAPTEVAALRRRTIRALANDEITDDECAIITAHLGAILDVVHTIKERRTDGNPG
jgi:Asp-tRNA(Asn)/Glu-tRNA(Gln) amidotransferase C subunit